ncbi:hypothetical protein SteCoe_30910 [Stentor coeruleus]|uniref:Uncharacterized protein n=1 Tax=Stentor coeruleus TaxID=5963 RepID=A0A1R2B2G3_9CILI|nr:hypothetical protein SteCoe_30910 [Stentor coeruleus]
MADISQLIDKRIDETFVIKAPKSYTAQSYARKPASNSLPPKTGRGKNIITPKMNIKEDRSLLLRAAKTRGESQGCYSSEAATTQAQTHKNTADPWKAHKRVALLQHPLWIESMKGWWNVTDPHDIAVQEIGTDGKITMEQYIDLNVRLQKALNPDFDYENACLSAAEDWDVDAEDWTSTVSVNETQHPCTPTSNYAPSDGKPTIKTFTFDKFSEFLFEVGEMWCDGSIESILVIINSALLHISQGVHLCSTVFKDIDSIVSLPNHLFQELSDMALSNPPKNMDFIKWYQRNFLEIISMREYVTERLFRIMPHEPRIGDLWISETGYNQTEVFIQCTNRLEGLLNRIQKSGPILLPITENMSKKKILPNVQIKGPVQKKRQTVPTLPSIKHTENEPIVMHNKIMFTRNINLALVGQSYSGRRQSQEVSDNPKNLDTVSIVYENSNEPKGMGSDIKPANSQKIGTDLSPLHSDRSFSYDQLFLELTPRRPFSTPLHALKKPALEKSRSYLPLPQEEEKKLFEESMDPEYTPKLRFNKNDVKYHKLQKSWRKGKFLGVEVDGGSPEVGEINKRSPLEYFEHKRKQGQEYIKTYEQSRQSKTQEISRSVNGKSSPSRVDPSDKKDSFAADDIERLVGIKISVNTPNKTLASARAPIPNSEKTAQTAPAATARKVTQKTTGATYTFEEYSHLVKPNKNQKLVFKDSLEFLYALNQAKYEFNTTHQSEFLKNYNKKHNDYRSRRDELGGHISQDEWKRFIGNLEQIIRITKKRRRNKKLRRKKMGKGQGMRRGSKLTRNRLWKNVFIKPFNQKNINTNRYLREIKKIDKTTEQTVPQYIEDIVEGTIKRPVPPVYTKPKTVPRNYSPRRFKPAK